MNKQTAIVTASYRGDALLAVSLCGSVDRFVSEDIEHILVIPRDDYGCFSSLVNNRRRIVYQEDLLPPGARRLPRLPLIRRQRDWWLISNRLVRGWIMQQIVKLSADRATDREVIVFADSDVVFVRPVNVSTFTNGDGVRLYHRPGETKNSRKHRSWHRAATKLLGLPKSNYTGADYIAQLVVWRRSVLQNLHAHLELVHRRPWQESLTKLSNLSEYILYGIYAEHVLGQESGHYLDTQDIVHSSWHYDDDKMDRFVSDFAEHHCAVLIQSTIDFTLDERRQLIDRMTI